MPRAGGSDRRLVVAERRTARRDPGSRGRRTRAPRRSAARDPAWRGLPDAHRRAGVDQHLDQQVLFLLEQPQREPPETAVEVPVQVAQVVARARSRGDRRTPCPAPTRFDARFARISPADIRLRRIVITSDSSLRRKRSSNRPPPRVAVSRARSVASAAGGGRGRRLASRHLGQRRRAPRSRPRPR